MLKISSELCGDSTSQLQERPYILPTNCSEGRCYEAAVPGTIRLRQKLVWWSRGVQEKNKDQQVATIVQDRTMKLEKVSSSPY